MRATTAAIAVMALFATGVAAKAEPASEAWRRVESAARGQKVYFNAWAGDAAINQYIDWAAQEVARRHGVTLVHAEVADISVAVARVLAERDAGRTAGGSVDLLWINGENFASLKSAGLLYGPWAEQVPNADLLDRRDPTLSVDFTVPTGGYELPWGGARFTLFYDAVALGGAAPGDPRALLGWIGAHPGRFTDRKSVV